MNSVLINAKVMACVYTYYKVLTNYLSYSLKSKLIKNKLLSALFYEFTQFYPQYNITTALIHSRYDVVGWCAVFGTKHGAWGWVAKESSRYTFCFCTEQTGLSVALISKEASLCNTI